MKLYEQLLKVEDGFSIIFLSVIPNPEINTLKRQGLSSLDRPGPLIHTEDFEGDSQELTKVRNVKY